MAKQPLGAHVVTTEGNEPQIFWEDFLGGILWEELLSRFLQGIDVFVKILG